MSINNNLYAMIVVSFAFLFLCTLGTTPVCVFLKDYKLYESMIVTC